MTNTQNTSGPTLITIQGNIGAGKSLLYDFLKKKYALNSRICFIPEPVNIWTSIQDENGKNMIEKYYGNQERYAFAFQIMAYISRLKILRDALQGDYDIIISERSLDTDKNVFAAMLYEDNKMEKVEHTIYTRWFSEFKKDFPEEHHIYVRVAPDVSFKRVIKRNRKGENIPLEYLQRCHEYHDDWLKPINKRDNLLVLNGDVDVFEEPDVLDKWVNEIETFCKIMQN